MKLVPGLVLALSAAAFLSEASARAAPVTSAESACAAVKAQVIRTARVPATLDLSCDVIPPASSPKGYYVLSLHGQREDCPGLCSTSMGWFAMRKADGMMFRWNVADLTLGASVADPR